MMSIKLSLIVIAAITTVFSFIISTLLDDSPIDSDNVNTMMLPWILLMSFAFGVCVTLSAQYLFID